MFWKGKLDSVRAIGFLIWKMNNKYSSWFQNFEVFPIVEDYTILFSKIVKKYGLITDSGLREKVKPFFEEKFFNSFMKSISSIFN